VFGDSKETEDELKIRNKIDDERNGFPNYNNSRKSKINKKLNYLPLIMSMKYIVV
jgi:hypothetical protein